MTTFNIEIGITGAILTKLDGDSRGGAALSVKEVCFIILMFSILEVIQMSCLFNIEFAIPLSLDLCNLSVMFAIS